MTAAGAGAEGPGPPRALLPGTSRLHDERTASLLGIALGVGFAVCFATGLLSHAIQHPPGWFHWPARPAGLYRITQGAHLVTGFALVPLTLAKLWVVAPRLSQWPPVRGAAHALERLALLPLVGGSLFLLVSGVIDVARWYPWSFTFPRTHHWAAWVTVGAIAVHVGAVWVTVRRSVGRRARREPPRPLVAGGALHTARAGDGGDGAGAGDDAGDRAAAGRAGDGGTGERRAFLAAAGATAGLVALGAGGGTVAWLSPLSAFAQRRPGQGPQGVPVNKSAADAGVVEVARDPGWRLGVEGAVSRPLTLTLADLRAMPQREATLPIACVEGWAVSARWRGVPLRDVLAAAGAREGADVTVESLQRRGSYRSSVVEPGVGRDRDTLLALELNGEALHLDHGFPVRLIAPNRPGVLQTKWVGRLVVA